MDYFFLWSGKKFIQGRTIKSLSTPIDRKAIEQIEKDLKHKYNDKDIIITGIFPLCNNTQSGEFIVRDITRGKETVFKFRSEAEEIYESIKGEGLYKVELLVRLSSYDPPEIL